MLSLNKTSVTNSNLNGIFDIKNDLDVNMEMAIDNIINDHRNSFLASKNNFSSDRSEDIPILRPSSTQIQRRKKILRIMSNRHKSLKKAKRYQNMSRL